MNEWLDSREFCDLLFKFRNQRGNGDAIATALVEVLEYIREKIAGVDAPEDGA